MRPSILLRPPPQAFRTFLGLPNAPPPALLTVPATRVQVLTRSRTRTAAHGKHSRSHARIPPLRLEVPSPTQSSGTASAPSGAAGAGGAFAGVGAFQRLAEAPTFYLSLRRGDVLLPEGKRVTLALDRPG